MKKILSVILGLALCCMLAALPVCAEETVMTPQIEEESQGVAGENAALVSDSDALIPVYVDEDAEGAEATVEQAMADFSVGDTVMGLIKDSGVYALVTENWKSGVMILISFVLLYLAIVKQFEPLLLLPIAFGMLLTNIPGANLFHMDLFLENQINIQQIVTEGGMLDFLYLGVKLGIYPPLIFLGVEMCIRDRCRRSL